MRELLCPFEIRPTDELSYIKYFLLDIIVPYLLSSLSLSRRNVRSHALFNSSRRVSHPKGRNGDTMRGIGCRLITVTVKKKSLSRHFRERGQRRERWMDRRGKFSTYVHVN